MRIANHVAITMLGAGILYNYTRSFIGSIWFIIAGIFIDLDHYFDYIRERGITFNFKKVHSFCRFECLNFKRIVIFLHSYEWVIFLWLGILLFNVDAIWKYIALGLTLHIISDQLSNPVSAFGYFLLYRAINGFETKKIFNRLKGGQSGYSNRP